MMFVSSQHNLCPVDTDPSCFIIVVITLLVDHNRIVLPSLPGKPGSDYINGNYIKVKYRV